MVTDIEAYDENEEALVYDIVNWNMQRPMKGNEHV